MQSLGHSTPSDAKSLISSLQTPIVFSPFSSDIDSELTLLYLAVTSRSSLTFRRDYLRLGFVQHVCGMFLHLVSTLAAPVIGPNFLRIAPPPSAIDSVTFRSFIPVAPCSSAIASESSHVSWRKASGGSSKPCDLTSWRLYAG